MKLSLRSWWIPHKLFLAACSFASLGLLTWSVIGVLQYCPPISQNCSNLPWDLVSPLVALGFWSAGIVAWVLRHQLSIVVFFFVSSAALAVGLLSGLGNDLAGRLFYIFLSWLSPVLFQFHIVWVMLPKNRLEKGGLVGLYLLACTWSIPFILNSITELQALGWFSFLRLGVRFTIALSLVSVIILLSSKFRQFAQPTTRFRIRLVFSGAVLAFAPLLLLSLLPSLLGAVFIPFEVNFVWLLFIPLSYGYSITNQKYFGAERAINRIIVYYLATVLFAGGYLLVADIVSFFIPEWSGFWAWAIAGMGMVFLFLFARVNQIVRQIANWILYGSEKSHLELLIQMADSLGPVLDRERLRHILVNDLASIVPSTGTALFLKTNGSNFVLQGLAGFDWQAPGDFALPPNGSLAAFLKTEGSIVENSKVLKTLAHATLVPEERKLLAMWDIGLWIPLISGGTLHGLLVIGSKPGGILFNSGDRQVWRIFAHQAGVAAHNLFLTEDLMVSRNELARAHQQLLYAREQERRQIASELHDNAVQQLLGINFQIAALQQRIYRLEMSGAMNSETVAPGLNSLRQEILQVTTQLREMIGELRPAGLEEFGFGSVLESFVHKLQRQAEHACPQIKLDIDQNGHELPEPVGICLFRVSQEALRNILKHANAKNIKLQLSSNEKEVSLKILDDGCGFSVPVRLSELTRANHYGLVGIAERVDWMNGQLEIFSQPGQGTKILVRIPL